MGNAPQFMHIIFMEQISYSPNTACLSLIKFDLPNTDPELLKFTMLYMISGTYTGQIHKNQLQSEEQKWDFGFKALWKMPSQ